MFPQYVYTVSEDTISRMFGNNYAFTAVAPTPVRLKYYQITHIHLSPQDRFHPSKTLVSSVE